MQPPDLFGTVPGLEYFLPHSAPVYARQYKAQKFWQRLNFGRLQVGIYVLPPALIFSVIDCLVLW